VKATAAKYLYGVALVLCTFAASAQQHGATPAPVPPPTPPPTSATSIDMRKLIVEGQPDPAAPKKTSADNCFLPPLNGLHATTVGVADLRIPEQAKKEFESACSALGNKNMVEAEKHLRKAVKQYQQYSAAWEMLGQTLEAQQKMAEARTACSQPIATNSNYLPAYLCQADISGRLQSWDDMLKLSTRALEIDPTSNAVAYAYNAAANFNLHNLSKAEESALKAEAIDKSNTDPRIHFLLAQIYEGKGDRTREAAQLREYLKYASDPSDIAMVTSYLSELDKQ
jgi:tetratricopeptide (TPR) repeat protein